MEQLLKHHIHDTERRFDAVDNSLDHIFGKLDDLHHFKVEMLVSARWVSLLVSVVTGFVTMVVTTALSYYLQKHG